MLTRMAIRQRSNTVVLDSIYRWSGDLSTDSYPASSFEHRNPYLHSSLLPVRPGVVWNERQWHPAALRLLIVVSRVQGVPRRRPVIAHASVAKHNHSSQQVVLEFALELRFGLRSRAHRQVG